MKFTTRVKFYAVSFSTAMLFWGILALSQVEFINIVFFLTAYVWHMALLTPGLKEDVMTKHHKLSFLAIIVRGNHYLQIFINLKRLPFASSFIRAISPALFTFLLFLVGGNGSMIFTLIGSLMYEVIYQVVKNKTHLFEAAVISPLMRINDQDIPPVIPNAENDHE